MSTCELSTLEAAAGESQVLSGSERGTRPGNGGDYDLKKHFIYMNENATMKEIVYN